jgi:hypothetical protein
MGHARPAPEATPPHSRLIEGLVRFRAVSYEARGLLRELREDGRHRASEEAMSCHGY